MQIFIIIFAEMQNESGVMERGRFSESERSLSIFTHQLSCFNKIGAS